MYSTNEFRKGLNIEHQGKPWVIVDSQFVSPGKGAAFVRVKMKNLQTGQVIENTYKSGERVPAPDLEFSEMQYLYNDGKTYTFMDQKSYEQVTLSSEDLEDAKYYIVENCVVNVTFFEGKAVAVEIANFCELEVAETQPNIKGDTSGGGGKPATTVTGLTLTVPFHIEVGDVLKIDTRTHSYVEKVKK